MDKRRGMDYREIWQFHYIVILWTIFAVSIVYWDIQRWENKEPVSACHGAEIKVYYGRNMCTKCKLFCEVKDEKK